MSQASNKSPFNSGAFNPAARAQKTRVPQEIRPVFVQFEDPGVAVRGDLVPPAKATTDSKD
jgi:hypothetical protein